MRSKEVGCIIQPLFIDVCFRQFYNRYNSFQQEGENMWWLQRVWRRSGHKGVAVLKGGKIPNKPFVPTVHHFEQIDEAQAGANSYASAWGNTRNCVIVENMTEEQKLRAGGKTYSLWATTAG
jgi:hypothetical protein